MYRIVCESENKKANIVNKRKKTVNVMVLVHSFLLSNIMEDFITVFAFQSSENSNDFSIYSTLPIQLMCQKNINL